MPLNKPPLKERPEVLSDWIELRTLADKDGEFRLSRLMRYWDTQREHEESDSEGLFAEEDNTDEDGISGGDVDKFLDAITDELGERAGQLGSSYPFEFSHDGNRFRLKNDLSLGEWTYIFCLLFEHHAKGDLWSGAWLPEINNSVRDIFQACSTLAAAGQVQGSAISFGWPRPENNPPFLAKLKDVYTKFGEGKPRDEPLPGSSPMVKDEEIDVIAWRPRPDKTPGTIYMLGQVASGDNWLNKSIKGGSIDFFHTTWFEIQPPSEPLAAIFIPHAVPPKGEGNRKDRMALLTAKFGMIFDRMLLPSMAQAGYVLSQENRPNFYIERVADSPKVALWVRQQMTALRNVGGVPL